MILFWLCLSNYSACFKMASALSWMWFFKATCSLIMNWNKRKFYVKEGVVSNGDVVVVDALVFDLRLGKGHQVSASCFDVFLIISFQIDKFHNCNLGIKSGEHWHQEVFLAFSVEVKIWEKEEPSLSWWLGEHENILGGSDESQEEKSSPKGQSVSSGETEVFVVSRYLLGAWYFVHCL